MTTTGPAGQSPLSAGLSAGSVVLAVLAMVAFAGNSVLNRLALADGDNVAWTFTLIRLLSGAVVLAVLTRFSMIRSGSWAGAVCLLIYAGGFSYAYLALDAGLGALILFAVVQFTMIGWGVARGERFALVQWIGVVIAFVALVWLLSPGAVSPAIWAVGAMAAAGVGWGVYSLIGRGSADPTRTTAGNFARAGLIALVLSPAILFAFPEERPDQATLLAAIASGAITSGLGYAIWYAVLPKLTRMTAGVMQLSVPAIAALGGVLLLGETLSLQLALTSAVILGGVALATFAKPRPRA